MKREIRSDAKALYINGSGNVLGFHAGADLVSTLAVEGTFHAADKRTSEQGPLVINGSVRQLTSQSSRLQRAVFTCLPFQDRHCPLLSGPFRPRHCGLFVVVRSVACFGRRSRQLRRVLKRADNWSFDNGSTIAATQDRRGYLLSPSNDSPAPPPACWPSCSPLPSSSLFFPLFLPSFLPRRF